MADRPDRDDHTDEKALTAPADETQVEPVAARDPAVADRLLTRQEFQGLAAIPPELEWFANITNANTKRAYKNDIRDFSSFVGIQRPEDMRLVTRAHVIAWRQQLAHKNLADGTIRRKLSAIAALFGYLTENNAVADNPVHGVKRPKAVSREGTSPALARKLLDAPDPDSLKGKRDRAILATLLFHGLRRAELCSLKVGDRQQRQGTAFLRIQGKGGKI